MTDALDRNAIIGIVGAGAMGGGIAEVAALAGHPVRLFDADVSAPTRAIAAIGDRLDRAVARGRLTESRRRAALTRLATADDLATLAPAALVIEAASEDLAVKRRIFTALDQACANDAILATNTSSLSVDAIAAGGRAPARVVGMHFFNPAPRMALVEVVSGLATAPKVAETVFATAHAWGKLPVHVRSTPGFIVNRVARPFYGEALNVIEEGGADAATVDAIIREAGGFPMGPLQLTDLIGQDVNYAVTCSLFEAFHGDPRYRPSIVQKALVDAGRLGRKSGQGFYDHRGGAPAPAASEAPPGAPPPAVRVVGDLGWAEPLLPLLPPITAVTVEPAVGADTGWVALPSGGRLLPGDGAPATEHAARAAAPVVVFDLLRDPATAIRVAVAAADGCPPAVLAEAVGLFQALGKRVSLVDDVPGLVLLRTVAMLVNEACAVVQAGIADADAVDTAMLHGVNYPEGPLAWGERLGAARVLRVLDNLARIHGDGRYRACWRLRRCVLGGRPLL